jgi:hypothetical protein
MTKLTSNINDIIKLSTLDDYISTWVGKQVELYLGTATPITGTVLLSLKGDNDGQGRRWSFGGSVILRMTDEDVEIDFLDIVQTTEV